MLKPISVKHSIDKLNYPKNRHERYHAHVYYTQQSLTFVECLSQKIKSLFKLELGTIHQKLVGSHPMWSVQITFSHLDFDTFVSWLDDHRNDLTVLIHPLTIDVRSDHTEHAYWLGNKVVLNLSVFR
tara:strand:- start:61 stop:441 length:381 start_codon:yes stop_codon:yes gene_type:complete